jgi:UTP--glucose-1-phosphate uridylyltransferase
MVEFSEQFANIAEKMRSEKLPEIAIKTFEHYYTQLIEGSTGIIEESDLEPIDELPKYEELEARYDELGQKVLAKTVMINLNGGLGTSMGLEKAKSLLPVKAGFTFLDILAKQATIAGVPLVLMNSFATRDDSLSLLDNHPDLPGDIPRDFLQHKVPKIRCDNFEAVEWLNNPRLEWCPPGHGDIYTALLTSGMLETLLNNGYEYAFISNADNLGASLDPRILGYFAEHSIPFMSEVARRTEADKKGGHLARRASDGQLVLREVAQTSQADLEYFQDVDRHRFFNTNSLWLNLKALQITMAMKDNILALPMIRNKKTVDPRVPDSPAVYQLETAMASAIAVFENSRAIEVPRSRFAPVKTTEDLIVVRSDATILNDDFLVVPNPENSVSGVVTHLDKEYYKLVDDFDSRFSKGVPSLKHCKSLTISGDVSFGEGIVCKGNVNIYHQGSKQKHIADNSELEGSIVSISDQK